MYREEPLKIQFDRLQAEHNALAEKFSALEDQTRPVHKNVWNVNWDLRIPMSVLAALGIACLASVPSSTSSPRVEIRPEIRIETSPIRFPTMVQTPESTAELFWDLSNPSYLDTFLDYEPPGCGYHCGTDGMFEYVCITTDGSTNCHLEYREHSVWQPRVRMDLH